MSAIDRRTARRHPEHRQAARGQRDLGRPRGSEEDRGAQRPRHSQRRADVHHPQLRPDGGGEVRRAAAAHGHRGHRRVAADPADARLARIAHRRHRHSLHPGPDSAGLLPPRLHAQPHHPLRADLLHRHPGGRRHRRGREHRPPLPPAAEQGPPLAGHRRRGRQRSRQPDHPGHLRRDLGGAADGLCRRLDGALHAADSHRLQRRDVLVAGHRLHRHALGRHPHSALGPEVFSPDGRRRERGRRRQAALPLRARGGFLHPALPALHGAADCQGPLAPGLPGGHRRSSSWRPWPPSASAG